MSKVRRVIKKVCRVLHKQKASEALGQSALLSIVVTSMINEGFDKDEFLDLATAAWDFAEETRPGKPRLRIVK